MNPIPGCIFYSLGFTLFGVRATLLTQSVPQLLINVLPAEVGTSLHFSGLATNQALQGNAALQTLFDGPGLIVFHDAALVGAECGHSRD